MQKADVIIDAAATRGSFMSILEAARPSSKIIVTGNYKAEMNLELPIIQRQEIEMIGHMMYAGRSSRMPSPCCTRVASILRRCDQGVPLLPGLRRVQVY